MKTTATKSERVPFHGGRCYACDAKAVGLRDRRPEGGMMETACKRHADPTIKTFDACIYCSGSVRDGSLDNDWNWAHKKCHAEVARDDN